LINPVGFYQVWGNISGKSLKKKSLKRRYVNGDEGEIA
jgi:hypothetical protein